MACKCIELVNQSFERADIPAMVSTSLICDMKTGAVDVRVQIGSSKTNPRYRKRAPTLICDYCPFCGVAYKPSEQDADAPSPADEQGARP